MNDMTTGVTECFLELTLGSFSNNVAQPFAYKDFQKIKRIMIMIEMII